MDGNGGNGNPYKQTGRKSLYDCGEHGETGEDCGNINIYDSLKVYAYGGKGGSGGDSLGSNSGGGGRRISGSTELDGGRSWTEVGGDHMNGGGGYTGGNRQVAPENGMTNGMAGSSTQPEGVTSSFDGAGGSGYFQKASDFPNGRDFAGPLGGRGKLYK